jgi:streptomycin 6-kinase
MMILDIPDVVRRRALAQGAAGEAWLAALPDLLADLARAWDFSPGEILTGGTEGLVVAATLADSRRAVLKLGPPGAGLGEGELSVLLAAEGRGYAALYRHDRAREALLMERLGPQLAQSGLPTDAQIEIICGTLAEAWRPPPPGAGLMNGAEKADSLARFIETLWEELDRPCPERTVQRALDHAAARRAAFDPDQAVLAHGDAHAWNTLAAPGGGYRFVDPDGLIVEPAYDLAIPMREWSADLLAGDPLELGRRRCRRLAELTGTDAEAIWQWGLMERVATGLISLKFELEGARDMLKVADAWAG